MMGQKDRRFDPLPSDVSLENLVPKDNFYRRLEATLDLSFVRATQRRVSQHAASFLYVFYRAKPAIPSLTLRGLFIAPGVATGA